MRLPSWLAFWRLSEREIQRRAETLALPAVQCATQAAGYWRDRCTELADRASRLETELIHARIAAPAPTSAAPKDVVDRVARGHHLAEIQAGDNWQALRAKDRQRKEHFRNFKLATAELVAAVAFDRPRPEIMALAENIEAMGAVDPDTGSSFALMASEAGRLPALTHDEQA